MRYWRRGYSRWQFPKLKCPDVWNPDTVVFSLIVGCLGTTNRTNAEQCAGEYKQIFSKSFHGELSFVKNSVNSLLLELKPVNFQSGVPYGTVLPPNHHFSIRGSAVIYNSQIAFNGCPLARRRCRRGGIVGVGPSVCKCRCGCRCKDTKGAGKLRLRHYLLRH